MPISTTLYRCLIISPGDVADAREWLSRSIALWNSHVGEVLGARVEAVMWETHSTPQMGGRPQAILNTQIVDQCDLGVAVFGARLGSPTGTHESGSVEEIERLRANGAHVAVYFSDGSIPQSALRDDQFGKLRQLRDRYKAEGLLGTYTDTEELGQSFQRFLTRTVAALLPRDSAAAPGPAVTASVPDIRVKVERIFTLPPRATDPETHVGITVENHSPLDFFLKAVYFRLENGSMLFPQRDSATGKWNTAQTVRPGDSYSFLVRASEILTAARDAGSSLTHGVAKDKIAREFRSLDGALHRELESEAK